MKRIQKTIDTRRGGRMVDDFEDKKPSMVLPGRLKLIENRDPGADVLS